MKRLEYLKLVISNSLLYEKLGWLMKSFGIMVDISSDDKWKVNPVQYDLVKTSTSLNYIDFNGGEPILVKIEDYTSDKPLFDFQEQITVDNSWKPNIHGNVTTKIGNVFINSLVIYPSFKDKVDFISAPINTNLLEGIIATRLKNDNEIPEGNPDKFITVKEMLEFIDRLYFINSLSLIVNKSATITNMTISKGTKAKKAGLMEKYDGQLTDPVKLVAFEKELTAFDDEYLKDDPTVGRIITGKVKDMARKKMFLDFGYERGLGESSSIKPIMNSLDEGWSLNDQDFTSYVNAIRSSSYSRGKETILGGVVYKTLQRSLTGLAIYDTDCGTTVGMHLKVTNSNHNNLVYREIRIGNKWVHIDNTEVASKYIGTNVVLRSALYCKLNKEGYCYHCLASILKDNPNAISTLASEMSSTVLGTFMSLMHGISLSTNELLMDDLVN